VSTPHKSKRAFLKGMGRTTIAHRARLLFFCITLALTLSSAVFFVANAAHASAATRLLRQEWGRVVHGMGLSGNERGAVGSKATSTFVSTRSASGLPYCNTGAITINDNGAATPYPSQVMVSGLPGAITKVTLSLNGFSHSVARDVDILLEGPGGQKFVVMSDAGLLAANNLDLILDDAAAASLPLILVSGTFKPTNYPDSLTADTFPAPAPVGPYDSPAPTGSATFASVFNGSSANGAWKLYVVDDLGGDTGSISSWCLTITTDASFCNPEAITINDDSAGSPYPSEILVSGLSGLITKVTVSINGLQHSFPTDVDLLLVGPGGQNLVVLSGAGSFPTTFNPANVTFDDDAATSLSGPIISGTYKPTDNVAGGATFPPPAPGSPQESAPAGSATFASVFNGSSANGTWQLYVIDTAAGDSGNISGGWCLTITTAASADHDYGDVPALNGGGSYEGSNPANHLVLDLGPRFGTLVDSETAPNPSNLATGDDLSNLDDEDGDTAPGSLPSGIPCSVVALASDFNLTINSFNNTGSTANIYAWIDLDADGLFEDSTGVGGEFRTATLGPTGVQTGVLLTWSGMPALPPLNTANGLRGYFVRFRITTDTLVDNDATSVDGRSRGGANDGEVEDYFIPYRLYDYGDAPDLFYGTSDAFNGARQLIRAGLFIGSSPPDGECDGQPSADATGDDTAGPGGNDEGGLTISIARTATVVTLPIPVTNTTGTPARLCGWIDFNRNRAFGDIGEGVCVSVPDGTNNTPVNLSWVSFPILSTTGNPVFFRMRLSTDSNLGIDTPFGGLGVDADGEVEDHLITIADVTAVNLASFNAYQIGDSVFIDWKTGYESDNLGFNLYRESGGQKVQVTPSLLAGSALMVGSGTRLEAGLTYAWRDDPGAAAAGSQYWLEEVDLNGAVHRHGPFSVASADALPLEKRRLIASQPRALRLNELADGLNLPGGTRAVEPTANLAFTDTSTRSRAATPQRPVDLSGLAAVKIEVRRAGWYRVPQAEIAAAGLGRSIDPRNLQLYAEGKQVPIRVTGEEDGSFDSGDAVEFYGVGLDVPSTDGRVYWLMESRLRGQRLPSAVAGGGGSPPASFSHTVIRQDRLVYVSAVLNGDSENFFGMPLANSIPTVTQTLSSPNVVSDASVTATLEVAIQGVGATNHSVAVSLNGTNLGTLNFQGQQRGVQTYHVNHSQLVSGDNLVKLEKVNPEADVVLVDHLKLTYQHAWKADSNSLLVEAQSGSQVSIGGFTASSVRILDVTNPDSPVELAVEVTGQQAGGFTASASVNGGAGQRTLYAFTGDLVRAAAGVEANQPSTWKRAQNGADFLVISHSSLIDAVQPLVALRRTQGWRVAVIDVDDLYDEFAYGSKTPEAISDFIAYAASSWTIKPKAVMLVGKGTYDPRYYMKQGDPDLVPIQVFPTETMESAVDDAYADFNGDGIPELAVGRLPARTPQETALMVSKIVAYESAPASDRVALVSDVSDTFNFDGISNQLAGLVPAGVQVDKISRGQLGDTLARQKVLEALGRANKIVNYAGHGSIDLWRGNLLTTADSSALQKPGEVSVFVMMTCLNGYFISPLAESLGESLLRVPGGAVAAWGSSGTTTPEGQQAMNIVAFQKLFGSSSLTIGEAARAAKAAVDQRDVRRTWNLLGDPTMRLK
jgi:subtilisin-like proprotein convertase family protein